MVLGNFGHELREKYAEHFSESQMSEAVDLAEDGEDWLCAMDAICTLVKLKVLTDEELQIAEGFVLTHEYGVSTKYMEPLLAAYRAELAAKAA